MKRLLTVSSILLLFTLILTACGGDGGDGDNGQVADQPTEEVHTGDVSAGDDKYHEVCVACHGPEGEGMEGLGKPFPTSEFLKTVNDQDLLDFIKVGRPTGDPDNTTGVDMPPKGGNPALTDEQILDIIAYIRTLQE